MNQSADLAGKAQQLREEFDLAFAEAAAAPVEGSVDFLALRLGGDPFALPLEQVSALLADKRITSLPASASEFCGIAGHRGEIVAVFDLAKLLGYAEGSPARRWIALSKVSRGIGLAFDEFEGFVRVAADAVRLDKSERGDTPPGIVDSGDTFRSVIEVSEIASSLTGSQSRRNSARGGI